MAILSKGLAQCTIVDVFAHALPVILTFDKIIVLFTPWCPNLSLTSMSTVKYQDLGITSAKNLLFESITCLKIRPLMCVNVFTSCEGTWPLSNLLEIHLQKGFIFYMSLRVSF